MIPYTFLDQETTNLLLGYSGNQHLTKVEVIVDFLQTIPDEILICAYEQSNLAIETFAQPRHYARNAMEALSLLTTTFIYNSMGKKIKYCHLNDVRIVQLLVLCSAIPKNLHYVLAMYCMYTDSSLEEVVAEFFSSDVDAVSIGDNFTEEVDAKSLNIIESLGCNYSKSTFLAHRCRFRLRCQIVILYYLHSVEDFNNFINLRLERFNSPRSRIDFIGCCRSILESVKVFMDGEKYDQLLQLL